MRWTISGGLDFDQVERMTPFIREADNCSDNDRGDDPNKIVAAINCKILRMHYFVSLAIVGKDFKRSRGFVPPLPDEELVTAIKTVIAEMHHARA